MQRNCAHGKYQISCFDNWSIKNRLVITCTATIIVLVVTYCQGGRLFLGWRGETILHIFHIAKTMCLSSSLSYGNGSIKYFQKYHNTELVLEIDAFTQEWKITQKFFFVNDWYGWFF